MMLLKFCSCKFFVMMLLLKFCTCKFFVVMLLLKFCSYKTEYKKSLVYIEISTSAQSQCFMTIFRSLKTNYNVPWLYLEILKINQRSITILGIIHHVNIKQFEYFLEPLVRTKQKLKNTRVLLKWTKND